MSRYPLLFLALASWFIGLASVRASKIDKQVFFRALVGRWEAKGELKGMDGKITTLKQSWVGKFDGLGGFHIEGERTMNDQTSRFSWTYTHNPNTDSYEANLSGGDGAQPLRFECSLADEALEMTLKSITGSGSAAIELEDRFEAKAGPLITKVRFTNEAGECTLEGSIRSERVKSP